MGLILEALDKLNSKNIDILDEDLRGWFKNNAKSVFRTDSEEELNKKAVALAKIDPTFKFEEGESDEEILKKAQGAYLPWLIKLIKKRVASYDQIIADGHEYRDQLSIFNDLKKRNRLPSDKKDIMNPSAGLNSLEDLMAFIGELGGGKSEDGATASHSDFKQDISDIRGCLKKLGLTDSDIAPEIQKTDDVLEFVGGNDKWEIWVPKNPYGSYILDRWGNGAKWCVGGSGWSGKEGLRQAENYFDHYNKGGANYVCFQQTDKNASRPTNKYLITLGPRGGVPETSAGYQFNTSDNYTVYAYPDNDRGYYGDEGDEMQMDALAAFLEINGLTNDFRGRFPDCECFVAIENRQRLENGEPYKYVGGKIKSSIKDIIDKIIFTDEEGHEHEVSAKEHPDYLNCTEVADMVAMEQLLIDGTYTYKKGESQGSGIKEILKPLITKIIVSDDYDTVVPYYPESGIGLPYAAFLGCKNLKEVIIPKQVTIFQNNVFRVNGSNSPYTDIKVGFKDQHPHIKVPKGEDRQWLGEHCYVIH